MKFETHPDHPTMVIDLDRDAMTVIVAMDSGRTVVHYELPDGRRIERDASAELAALLRAELAAALRDDDRYTEQT